MTQDEIDDLFADRLAEIIQGAVEDLADSGMSYDEIAKVMKATILPRLLVGLNASLRSEPPVSH